METLATSHLPMYGSQGDYDSYPAGTPGPLDDWRSRSQSVLVSDGYSAEARYRERSERSGVMGVLIAGKVVFLSTLMEGLHLNAVAAHDSLPGSFIDKLALMHIVDWRGVAAATAAYAVKSTIPKIHHALRFDQDIEAGQTDGFMGRERLAINTARERRAQHFRQRLGRFAVAAIGCAIAYKGAEHSSPLEVEAAALGSIGFAFAGAMYAKRKATQRMNQLTERLMGRSHSDDPVDGYGY